jgi:hypothetical protein
MTCSVRIAKKERHRMEREQMTDVFLNTPTTKTASITKYLQHVNYIVWNMDQILEFNNQNTAETRLHLYQGLQRARQEMTNMLINGGRKYNKRKRKNTRKNRRRRQKKKHKKNHSTSNTEGSKKRNKGKQKIEPQR